MSHGGSNHVSILTMENPFFSEGVYRETHRFMEEFPRKLDFNEDVTPSKIG